MAFLDIGNIYNAPVTDDIFIRFQGACIVAAKDVLAEDAQTLLHAQRMDWANSIFNSDQGVVQQKVRKILRFSIATNSTFQSVLLAVTDGDIGFMVASAIALINNL